MSLLGLFYDVSCFCEIKVENFLQLSGLVVGGIGIWTVVAKHSYVSLMSTSTYPTLAYALIVAGVLAVIGSWLGCGGVTSENRCVLLVVSPRVLESYIIVHRLTFDINHKHQLNRNVAMDIRTIAIRSHLITSYY